MLVTPALAQQQGKFSYIAIIIDDLGYNWKEAQRTIRLPGPIAVAILPHTRFATDIANLANSEKKEVLLHLPMESTLKDKDPGPGKLDSTMPDLELALTIDYDLQSVPHAVGVNNHMGSLFTTRQTQMETVISVLHKRGNLFFVDSLTSPQSKAALVARKQGLPNLVRDVFLDSLRSEVAIEKQFDQLLELAQRQGFAVAIGHPYPETLAVLERRLPALSTHTIKLCSLSFLISALEMKPTP